jgi:DivIVA domain-containing protein
MTTSTSAAGDEHRLTPDVVRDVRFSHGTMLHPGYTDTEVDSFVDRVSAELDRLATENAQLRDQVQRLEQQVADTARPPSPSDQAVGILATAQLTADRYVADAEEFSRQMTSEARLQYEEQLSQAREKAGAIIQAAQETGIRITSGGGGGPVEVAAQPSTEDLEEQVAYLRAFGQACRTQLRSYLEALLSDVESEWGRAHPAAMPEAPRGVRVPRQPRSAPATFHSNETAEDAADDPRPGVPAATGSTATG